MTGEVPVLRDGLGIPESLRWRDGRVLLADWGAGTVLAVSPSGDAEPMLALDPGTLPLSVEPLGDGGLAVVDGPGRRLLRHDAGGLRPWADLTGFGPAPFNEVVADDRGGVYVNGGAGLVVHVAPDGTTTVAAEGLRWPNGMVLVDGGATLVVADSHAVALVAYDVHAPGVLGSARTWARLDHAPDGICADTDGAIWVSSVPGEGCVRVREGGEVLDRVAVDRGCFSCVLGGADGRTLFVGAAQWHGLDHLLAHGPGRTGQLLAAPGRPAPGLRF